MDLKRLKVQLLTSGLQQKDPTLFQVINTLIDEMGSIGTNVVTVISGGGGGYTGGTYITETNEVAHLPHSRRLIAGTNITFDISVANQLSISAAGGGSEWDVLTNGDADFPEVLFADGEVIMLETP